MGCSSSADAKTENDLEEGGTNGEGGGMAITDFKWEDDVDEPAADLPPAQIKKAARQTGVLQACAS